VANWSTGIRYVDADDGNITNNNASSNFDGVILLSSSDNNVISNDVTRNVRDGILLDSSSGNNLKSNNATGNGGAGISLSFSSNNNDVIGNNVSGNSQDGLGLASSSSNNISANKARGNDRNGIELNNEADGNNVTSNSVSRNGLSGILVFSSSENNDITDNNVTGNNQRRSTDEAGIRIEDSADTEITKNRVRRNNVFGVLAVNASRLAIRNSMVAGNDGVVLSLQTDNTTLENVDVNSSVISGTATQVDINETVSPPADPSNAQNIGQYFNATNRTSGSFFDATVSYTDADASGVDESSLALWNFDGNWTKLVGSTVDTGANTVSANITSFSVFAPLGNTGVSGPGAGGECIDRRDLSRGQEDQECPNDRDISRGGSREDIDSETGRRSDTSRRDRGRRSRGR